MAQPSDNSLGAPTEGLGQKVTFAFNPDTGVPSLQLGGDGRVRGGVQGGGTVGAGNTQGVGVQAPPNPTLDLLMKVGGAILKPYAERAKTAAFVSGMQRAMQGEAVTEIAEKQPWYSHIFGESDVVEGARAYAGHTVAQTQIAAMEDKMPELRKMEPLAAQKFFTESMQANLTGDQPADASILQAMTRALPAVMRRQAKEHYGYQQEVASTNEAAAFKAGATRLQSSATGLASGTVTPEEYDALSTAFVRSLVPAQGRDIKNYKDSMAENLTGWAADGNFHALNAVRAKGFFDVLDTDQRNKVDKAVEAGEAKLRNKYSMAWSDQLASIEAQKMRPPTGTTTEDLAHGIDAMNMKYKAETGSGQDFILPRERSAYLAHSSVAIATERDRQADEAAKLSAKNGDVAVKNDMIAKAVTQGWANTLAANKGYSKEDINAVAFPVYQGMPPDQQHDFLIKNYADSYVIEPVKNIKEGQVATALSSENVTPDVQKVFADYATMANKNQYVADAYYGQYAAKMSKFKHAIETGSPVEGAYRSIFVDGRVKTVDHAALKIGQAQLESDYNSFLPFGVKFQPGQARAFANHIGNDAVAFGDANGDVKNGWKRAAISAQANGSELLGGYFWQNSKGQTSLAKYLTSSTGPTDAAPLGTDTVDDAFAGAIKHLTKSIGDTPDDVAVIRLADQAGIPMFHVQAVKDGKVADALLNGSDILRLAQKERAESAAKMKTFKETAAGPFVTPGNTTADRIAHLPNIVGKPTR